MISGGVCISFRRCLAMSSVWCRLGADDIDRAERELTRLTAASRPALTIIRLLHDTLGLAFNSAQQSSRMPGFLFDMNIFFQRLLSRFLHDNLTGTRIADELAIRNLFAYAPDANPRQRRAPAPRPDYALFRGNTLLGIPGRKISRHLGTGPPGRMAYQLSIYALASPSEVSVLLYASMAADARDERVEVRQPVLWSNKRPASVILASGSTTLPRRASRTPIDLRTSAGERRELADQLVVPRTRKPDLMAA